MKNKKPVKPVTAPFLKGKIVDRNLFRNSMGFLGTQLLMVVVFLMVATMLNSENLFLRYGVNGALLLSVWIACFFTGSAKGTNDVAVGERLYDRQEGVHSAGEAEKATSYHPLKGFVIALTASLPLVIVALVLALTAQKQVTGMGMLPDWTATYRTRPEIGTPLAFYMVTPSFDVTGLCRTLVRILLMPMVGMVGAANHEGILLLERLSPLLVLLPGLCYGLGYTRGVQGRSKVHTSIAENNKKRRKQAAKAQKKRAQASQSKSNMLN